MADSILIIKDFADYFQKCHDSNYSPTKEEMIKISEQMNKLYSHLVVEKNKPSLPEERSIQGHIEPSYPQTYRQEPQITESKTNILFEQIKSRWPIIAIIIVIIWYFNK